MSVAVDSNFLGSRNAAIKARSRPSPVRRATKRRRFQSRSIVATIFSLCTTVARTSTAVGEGVSSGESPARMISSDIGNLSHGKTRPVRHADRRSPVRLCGRCEYGREPFLELNRRGESPVASNLILERRGTVVNRLATGDEIRRDFRVPKSDLRAAARAEVVSRPHLQPLAFATDPVTDELVIVRVQCVIEKIPVNVLTVEATRGGRIGSSQI